MSADTNIAVKMVDGTPIEGSNPIVVIGPNGSGKTQYGIQLGQKNKARFIAALRNIALDQNIPMQGLSQADQELQNHYKAHYNRRWQMSNEINYLFSKLLAENAASAVQYRDARYRGEDAEIEFTKIMRLQEVWVHLFPGRHVDFSSYSAKVQSEYAKAEYFANQMSDGERVALYLAARVLEAESGIVVVDEPEIHFHSRLAVRFWNELEALRPDMRFVYITHDLPFALSRQTPKFIVVKPNENPQVIEEATLPTDIAESLLGAASFSIYASRIVFCEGDEGKTSDFSLYSAWFGGRDTVVIPVGSCQDVIDCTKAFRESSLINGVEAIGIIDRDYRPDSFFDNLQDGVLALPVHEIENLYCLEGVFLAVARHLSIEEAEANEKYGQFLVDIRRQFNDGIIAKQISERFKKRCEMLIEGHLNQLRVDPNLETMKSEYISSMDPSNLGFDPATIFDEEATCITDAINGSVDNLMKYLPGKSMLGCAAQQLRGMPKKEYRDLVDSTLASSETSDFQNALYEALNGILPPRHQPEQGSES